jgi:pyruvate formate lyase activating enzyme
MSTGIIFDIKRYTIHDGPGIRTTVFFKGCPLKCLWCHNPESQNQGVDIIDPEIGSACLQSYRSDSPGKLGYSVSVDEIVKEIEKDILFYEQSGGGVTISGGEPLLQPEFLNDLLVKCRQKDIPTALDTCGYASWEVLSRIKNYVDLFLYDLKFINNDLHQKYTGVSNNSILENIKKLSLTGNRIIIRIPIIPGITDGIKNMRDLAGFISSQHSLKQISLLPYNFLAEEKYRKLNKSYLLQGLRPGEDNHINEIKSIFEESGLEVSIGG